MDVIDSRRCAAEINLEALRANFKALKALAPGKKICSVIKADAYGHGALKAAEVLYDGTDVFAVATMGEALALRKGGVKDKTIMLLSPPPACEDKEALKYSVTQTVTGPERAVLLNNAAGEFFYGSGEECGEYAFKDKKAHVHIAVDTGMSRIGVTPDREGLSSLKEICSLKNISADGVFMHFATADEKDKTGALKAYEKFLKFKELVTEEGIDIPVWHAANTAAVIEGLALDGAMDMVRLGIGLYGMYPSDEVNKENARLRPAMRWYSFVTFIKDIAPGTKVSYGYTFTAGKPMRIGTVCAGYADGYPRLLSGRGRVLIRGKSCPILGRVCMDQFMVDLTGVPEAEEGDEAVLMGKSGAEEVTADEIAGLCGTICYEITCGVSKRVPRIYV